MLGLPKVYMQMDHRHNKVPYNRKQNILYFSTLQLNSLMSSLLETHVIQKETQFDFLKQCMKKGFFQKNRAIYFLAATGDGQYTVKNMMQIYRRKVAITQELQILTGFC